jgi:hypothetical protein
MIYEAAFLSAIMRKIVGLNKYNLVKTLSILFFIFFLYLTTMHISFLLGLSSDLDSWTIGFIIPIFFIFPASHLRFSKEYKGLIKTTSSQAKKLRIVLNVLAIYSIINFGWFALWNKTDASTQWDENKIIALLYSSILMVVSYYFFLLLLFGRAKNKRGKYRIISVE